MNESYLAGELAAEQAVLNGEVYEEQVLMAALLVVLLDATDDCLIEAK